MTHTTNTPTNAPERIYLVVGDEAAGFPFSALHDVTWCADRQGPHDVEYVLAAPVAAQPPAPAQQPVSGTDGLPDSEVAARLDALADAAPAGSLMQSDLYAAATAWRKHMAGPTAQPQPSGISGDLPEALIPAEPDLNYLRSMAAENALPAMLRGEIEAAVRWIEVTKPSGQAQQDAEPDMYWDANDPERFAATDLHGAVEYIMDDYADSDMPMDLEFQCAQSMPNVLVRVTARSDADGYTYEVLNAARQEQLP